MGLRFLAFLVLIGLLIYFLGRYFQNRQIKADEKKKIESRATVQCNHCGIYIPKAEAIEQDGQHYCGRDHLSSSNQPED